MWLNLNGFGYDIANDCNATERVYLQSVTWFCIDMVHLSLPQKIGNLVQCSAHTQQLILAKDDQAFIIGIVGGADELDDFGVHRYALAAIVGHHNEGDHGLSFGENFAGALNIGVPCALTLPSAAQEDVAGHAIPAHLCKDVGNAFRMQAGSAAAIGLAGFSTQAPLQPGR